MRYLGEKMELKLRPDVQKMIDLSFETKLEQSKELIRIQTIKFRKEDLVVAWSGGKDSTLVLYLIREQIPDVPVVFCDTGVEYPETYEFIDFLEKEWNLNLIKEKWYKKSFWQCIEDYGFPMGKRKKEGGYTQCCYYLKKKPMQLAIKKYKWKVVFDGLTAVESRHRMFIAEKFGKCFKYKSWDIIKVRPILYWSVKEVWKFIQDNKIPFNKIYEKGAERCGCMPCTAFLTWREQLRKTNPKMYQTVQKMRIRKKWNNFITKIPPKDKSLGILEVT